jgi:hypothetical protein
MLQFAAFEGVDIGDHNPGAAAQPWSASLYRCSQTRFI